MNRREFLTLTTAAGAALFVDRLGLLHALAAQPLNGTFDLAAARRELAAHHIASIDPRTLEQRFPRFVGANAQHGPSGWGGQFRVSLITTDKGAIGWGDGYDARGAERFIGAAVGDLFDVENGTGDDVPRWIEMPLYDLAGHILDTPVYEMIGGHGPRNVYVYSGAVYFGDLLPDEKPRGVPGVIAACRQDYELGYRAFKLKMGRGNRWMPRPEGLKRDIEVTRAVREEFPDCRILVDANDGWTVRNACDYVKAVADCNLYWIEEPFWENADDLRRLKDAMHSAGCTAYIADGEDHRHWAQPPTAYGGYTREFMDHLYKLAGERLVDVFVMDIFVVGFSRWRKIMPELKKAGVWAAPHTWNSTMKATCTVQLAAGAGNVCIVEGIPAAVKGADFSAYRFEHGHLVMPQKPGFGLTLES
jgi:D-galactarolactone cycloisomerase